jgi:hypothetical protein
MPRVVAGRYRLDRMIGRGAMGAVWQAEDTVLRRPVAVKEVLLPHGLSPHEREVACERTLREARAIARLAHPNVVTLFDVLDEDGRPWVVMELVPARSLAQVVREEGPLPAPRVAALGLAVLSALEAAHAAGITHRDVKPGNILLADDGRVKLTDFGIARIAEDSALTGTGLLLGSPSYIAPEVVRGGSAGPAADLFGLGATLYAAVEGRPPFRGEDPISTLSAVASQPPEPYRLAGSLAPALDGLLRKDPDGRLSAAAARRLLLNLQPASAGVRQMGTAGVGQPGTASARHTDVAGSSYGSAAPPHVPVPTQPHGQPVAGRGYPGAGHAAPRHAGRSSGTSRTGALVVVVTLCIGVVIGAVLLAKGVFGGTTSTANRSGSVANGAAPVPAGYATFTDPTGHYTVGVPQGWQPAPQRAGVIDVTSPTDDGQFLRFISMPTRSTALSALSAEEPGLAGRYRTYHKLGLAGVDYRGYDAADWEFTFVKGGATKHVLYRTFVLHGWLYGLYLSAPDGAFGGLRPYFDTAAATFAPTS